VLPWAKTPDARTAASDGIIGSTPSRLVITASSGKSKGDVISGSTMAITSMFRTLGVGHRTGRPTAAPFRVTFRYGIAYLSGLTPPGADLGSVAGMRRRSGLLRPELSWLPWWLTTGLLALVLLPLNVALAATQFDVHPLVAFVAGIGQSTALVLLLVWPWAAVALQFLAVAVFAVAIPADPASTWPLTVPGMVTLIVYAGIAATRTSWRAALATWWGSVLLITLVVFVDPNRHSVTDGLAVMVLYSVLSAFTLGAVLLVSRLREVRRELAVARHNVEVEQGQRALAEERTRIARELHDVVAHHVSMIAVQAETARLTTPGLPPAGARDLVAIADNARTALTEMRRLLGVLREDAGTETGRRPQPGLEQLNDLIDQARDSARASTRLIVRGAVVPLDPGIQLTAYRIVQEALTNVRKHAGGAPTAVRVAYRPDAVALRVADRGPGPAGDPHGNGGHGLTGMHERARMCGGELRTGPGADGGFVVEAVLPT